MKKMLFFALLSAFLWGCGNGNGNTEGNTSSVSQKESMEKVGPENRKLIKNGRLRFQTNNIEKTYQLIKNGVFKYGAHISEESNANSQTEVGYDITIRVPAEKFDSLLGYIIEHCEVKELNSKSVQINDVTEKFIDTEARIKVKKESEQKLLELLKQAKNLNEVLEIQKQLTDLRADIESIEGRMKYLTDQVDYSTLKISFYQKIKYSERFFKDFWAALKDGGQVFLHTVTLLAYLWVIILVVILGRWGYRSYRKRQSEKK